MMQNNLKIIRKPKSNMGLILGKDVLVTVKTSPDHVTLASIKKIPMIYKTRWQAYKHIREKLEAFGGKIILSLPADFYHDARRSGAFKSTSRKLFVIRVDTLKENLENRDRELETDKLPVCELVTEPHMIAKMAAAILAFKREHSGSADSPRFVTPAKILMGVYTELAERQKGERGVGVQCVLKEKASNKILAMVLLTQHDHLIYAGDFIVDEKFRQRGLGTLLFSMALKKLRGLHDVQNVAFVTGKTPWLHRFYASLGAKAGYNAVVAMNKEPKKQGAVKEAVIGIFGHPAGPELLDACKSKPRGPEVRAKL